MMHLLLALPYLRAVCFKWLVSKLPEPVQAHIHKTWHSDEKRDRLLTDRI